MNSSFATAANITLTSQEESLVRRVWWRITPLIMVIYLISVIDKMNVSFAKLQMVHDIGLTETAYGLASSLFFIGYLAFEIPSALAVHRFGAPKWFFRIMLSWAIATLLIAHISSGAWFAGLRFLVGAAEAGLYPGIIYFLSIWLPRRYQVRGLALLTLGSALGNMTGSAVGGLLMSLDNVWHYAGWQWVFIVTGLLALVAAPVVLWALPDRIETAPFLTPEERDSLKLMIAAEAPGTSHTGNIWSVLRDRRVLVLALGYTVLTTSLNGVIYWLPTVIKGFGVSNSMIGMLTMVPWALTSVLLLTVPRVLKTDAQIRVAAGVIGIAGAAAFVLSMLVAGPTARYVLLIIGTPCTSMLLPCFWSLPSKYFSGRRMAAGLATVSCIGNFGGFIAQNLMPWIGRTSGHAGLAMLLPAACLLLLGCAALIMQAATRRPS